jgi:hypothetical protein
MNDPGPTLPPPDPEPEDPHLPDPDREPDDPGPDVIDPGYPPAHPAEARTRLSYRVSRLNFV